METHGIRVINENEHVTGMISEKIFDILQQYLYPKKLEVKSVNEARQVLFSKENIPSIKEVLHKHVLRSAYEAGQVWYQSLYPLPEVPPPGSYGWRISVISARCSGWKP